MLLEAWGKTHRFCAVYQSQSVSILCSTQPCHRTPGSGNFVSFRETFQLQCLRLPLLPPFLPQTSNSHPRQNCFTLQSDYGGRGVGRDPLCICPQALAQVGSCPSKRVAAPCPTSNHAHEPRSHLHPARSSQASGEAARGLYHHGDLGGDARTAYTTTERCVLSPLPAGCPGVPLGYHGRAHEGQHGVWAASREAVLGVTGLTGRTRMNRPNLSGMDEGSKTETHPRLFRN